MVNSQVIRLLTIWILFVGICFGVFVFGEKLLTKTLIIEAEQGNYLSLPTYSGDTFSLRFIHSVHKTPVWENFTVGQTGRLILTSAEYQSYGAGMPSLTSEGTFIQERGRFIIKDLDRQFNKIPVRAGSEASLTLVHKGKEYPLYELFEPGTLLFIHGDRRLLGFSRSLF